MFRAPNTNQPRRQSRNRKFGLRLPLTLIGLVVGILGLHFIVPRTSAAQHQVGAAAQSHSSSSTSSPTNKPKEPDAQSLATMDGQINAVIDANPTIDVSATLIDLNTGNTRNYGPVVAYEAASVAKLITAADYLHQVEMGTQSTQTVLDNGLSASQDIKNMVILSDNDAWQALNDQMSLDNLAAYSQSIGITDYNLNDNTLTTGDIGLLLQKLYQNNLLNKTNTNLMLDYMKQANEAGYIPPVVPSGVAVYHKAGLLDDRVHDSAIIDNGTNPIVLVIFTNGHGTYDFPGRTTIIQSITTAALNGYGIK